MTRKKISGRAVEDILADPGIQAQVRTAEIEQEEAREREATVGLRKELALFDDDVEGHKSAAS